MSKVNMENFNLIPGGYFFTQTAILFAHYGLNYKVPFWVRWFPTLFLIIFLFVCLVVFIIFTLVND